MKRIRLIHINNGLGSGNVGDELMAQGFWKLLPESVMLDVPLLAGASRYRGTYPERHKFYDVSAAPRTPEYPGLLVGDTPIAEFEGLQYPLGAIGPALSKFFSKGLPVDAIAVGVDRLHTEGGRRLFQQHYAPIRSWTVRTEDCQSALVDLGVPAETIRVTSDLAWLFEPGTAEDAWAESLWRRLGITPQSPLLVVNVTHHTSPEDLTLKRIVASALDELAFQHGFQIAFLSNETRTDAHFDTAAAEAIQRLMKVPSVLVPNAYYTPQEMVSLLRPATAVLSQRYHMAIQAVLAGTLPVGILRGQKLAGLVQDLRLISCSLRAEMDPAEIVAAVKQTGARRPERLKQLAEARDRHRRRAGESLSFLNEYLAPPAKATRRKTPERIAILHLGGLGDLVLGSSLIAAMRDKYPSARIQLFCRAPFTGVARLFPSPPDATVGLPFDPSAHTQPTLELDRALAEMERTLGAAPDLFVSAELEPSWLSWYISSLWTGSRAIACSRVQSPRGLLPILLHERKRALALFEGPEWSAELTETDRYGALATHAGCSDWKAPRWEISADQEQAAQEFLAAQGLAANAYAVCFQLGAASTLVKRWPAESFSAALHDSTNGFQLPVLLTGESSEEPALREFASRLEANGAKTAIFAGNAADLPLLAALLAHARFFLGNDTGPAHLAQAYSVPGTIIFGGGTWPHYRPWGPGTVGVVHPLACFGCRWDCAFGHALCIDAVPVGAVQEALRQAKAAPQAPAAVVSLQTASPELQTITGAASQRYQAAQADRLARYHALVETEHANAQERAQVARLSARLEQRSPAGWATLQDVDSQLARVDERLETGAGAARALVEQDNIWRVAAEERLVKLHESEKNFKAIELEAGLRSQHLEEFRRMLLERDSALTVAQSAAAERLQLVERVSDEIGSLRGETARRLAALEEANQILAVQQEEIDRIRNESAGSRSMVDWQSQRIVELEEAAAARLAAIEEANALLREQHRVAEEQHIAIGSLRGEVQIKARLMAEYKAASQERLKALGEASSLIAAERGTATERLQALEHVNRLLAAEQAVVQNLRQREAVLQGELTLQERRLAVAEPAAAERLEALRQVNALLAAEQAMAQTLREQVAELTGEVAVQGQRLAVAEPAAAERLEALRQVNALLAAEQGAAETLRQQIAALTGEVALQSQRLAVAEPAAAERLEALRHVNELLAAEQAMAQTLREQVSALTGEVAVQGQRLTVAEPAAAERLEALQQANALLAAEQTAAQALREQVAALAGEVAVQAQRLAVAEPAAAERLAALLQVNEMLAAEQTAAQALREQVAALAGDVAVQAQRLDVAEPAAAERLVALTATDQLLRRRTALHTDLETSLQQLRQAQAEANQRQELERNHLYSELAELRTRLNEEREARLAAESLAERLQPLLAERDRLERSAKELAHNELALLNQVLAMREESLLQSIFRRFRSAP